MAFPSFSNFPSSSKNGHTSEELRNKIDKEISQIEARLSALKTFRNSLAPISQLPTELFSKVFGHLRDGGFTSKWDRYSETPFIIARVCRQWREIALANPYVWSTITNGTSDQGITDEQIEIALKRSQNRLLSVSLYDPSSTGLIACLFHIDNIRDLKVVFSSTNTSCMRQPIVQDLLQQLEPAPQLTSLHFDGVVVPDPDLALFSGDLPSLTSVHLRSSRIAFSTTRGKSLLSGSTITQLHLSSHYPLIQAPSFSEILVSLLNLQELQVIYSLCEEEISRTIPRTSLPNLQTFKIIDEPTPTFSFLEWFDIPGCFIHISFGELPDPSFLGYTFQAYRQTMSFDIRHLEIKSDPEKPSKFTFTFSSDKSSHRYSLQIITNDIENDVTDILEGLELFQVTHFSILGFPVCVADALSILVNVEVLSAFGSPEDSRSIVEALCLDHPDSDDEDDEVDVAELWFPKLREVVLDELDDDTYERLLEALDDREEVGFPRVDVNVKGREQRRRD